MKKIMIMATAIIALASCKNDKTMSDSNATNDTLPQDSMIDSIAANNDINNSTNGNNNTSQTANTIKSYPAELSEIFEAHGSLARWKKMNNICFEIKDKLGDETTTVSLKNRQSKIESKKYSIGKDGTGVWLLQNEVGAYQGNAKFYHNLMFYFYAMPFVLADEGTNYTAVGETELNGKMYKGYKVGYNAGIGDSPKDEYILYFDAATKKMTWLGYTVTYGKEATSADWHFIKYDKWQEVNGFQLPEKITWYNVENGKPKGEKSDIHFDKVTITETVLDNSVFKKPAQAEYVKG